MFDKTVIHTSFISHLGFRDVQLHMKTRPVAALMQLSVDFDLSQERILSIIRPERLLYI